MHCNFLRIAVIGGGCAGLAMTLKMPDAVILEAALHVEQSTVRPITPRSVTIDLSTDYWLGQEEHYSFEHADGTLDEFRIHIIATELSANDVDFDSLGVSARTDVQVAMNLDTLDFWTCEWAVGCFEKVRYAAAVSETQITAAIVYFANYLRNADYKVLRSLLGGYIEQFAIGILSNIAGFYIGNKLQGQAKETTDSCHTDDLEAQIAQLSTDVRNLMEAIQAGDSRPRRYSHYSEDKSQDIEGRQVIHTCVIAQNPEYMNINTC